ncbi:GNAT family N-acetyltransferase [Cohnella fermenti]|uniref:GNAT family N-acetyltransferase n=1 Tax=Cohnella fermenti TaxID=2565925 RepID=A0A4S4BF24_9BACL|nr:GNAT family N-acetyltransferase [Cohnella fermenti]THF72875.1 GNAT family N-acetyltransferase [Cohnella fermenti]
MDLQLRCAAEADLDLLAEMNKHLIEDEGSTNPMSLAELKTRMLDWLRASWQIDLLVHGSEVVGYVLYFYKNNPYRPHRREAYVRQYFIRREWREKGFGLRGIELLKELRFKNVSAVEIDVLAANSRGRSFWQRAGFVPYAINMKREL